jgi:hypothetical protein
VTQTAPQTTPTAGPSPDLDPAPQLRSRHRFFAFSAVGVAMVCVPLAQVLQYQNNDLQQLKSERALLDPVSQAVTTQHSLLNHRDLAGQVLMGRTQFEGERQFAQGDVNLQMASLAGVLTGGAWTFALAEARTLTEDWNGLAADVTQRRISAPQSFDAHALRLEQTLQVIDLVSVSQVPAEGQLPATRTAFAASARLLPRMAREMDRALGQGATTPTGKPADKPAAQPITNKEPPAARLKAVEAAIVGAAPSTLVPAFAAVASTNQDHLHSLQAAATGPQAPTADAQLAATQMAAAKAARQAQLHLFTVVRAEHQAALQARIASVQQQRVALWALLGALASVALGLGLHVLQGLALPALALQKKVRGDVAATGLNDLLAEHDRQDELAGQQHELTAKLQDSLPDDPPPATAPSSRTEASRLLGRLRRGEGDAGDFKHKKPRPAQRQNEHEDTLPP